MERKGKKSQVFQGKYMYEVKLKFSEEREFQTKTLLRRGVHPGIMIPSEKAHIWQSHEFEWLK